MKHILQSVLFLIIVFAGSAAISKEGAVVDNPNAGQNRERFDALISKLRPGSEALDVCAKSEIGHPSRLHRFYGFEFLQDPFDDREIFSGVELQTVSTRDINADVTRRQLASYYQYEESGIAKTIQRVTVTKALPIEAELTKLWSDVEARHTFFSTKLDDEGNGIEQSVSHGFFATYSPSDCGCKIGICEFVETRLAPAKSETRFIQKQVVEKGLWVQSVHYLDASRQDRFGPKVWEARRSYLESGMPLDFYFKNESSELVLFRAEKVGKK